MLGGGAGNAELVDQSQGGGKRGKTGRVGDEVVRGLLTLLGDGVGD